MWPFKKKNIKLAESGIFDGFIDWHCHLLPGVDDGVKEQEETFEILSLMESLGFKKVYLTPHIMEEIPNTPSDLKERFSKLCEAYTGSLELHLGAEHMIDFLYTKRVAEGNVLQIEPTRQWLLVETSFINPPMGLDDIIAKTFSAGHFPLLAHPERYCYMRESQYKSLKQRGVLFQLNLPSLAGMYGPEAKAKAEYILEKGWYDRIGTDTHSMRVFSTMVDSSVSRRLVPNLLQLRQD